jgi:dihydrofolate reductase
MKTQYYTACRLDGFIATEDHSLECVGALAMGSSTYEWMLKHVVKPDTGAAAAWPYAQPTWVFSSRSLTAVAGALLHFVRGTVRPVHEHMRQAAGDRNIWLVGGGELVGQFYDAGLLNEIIVQVGSVRLCTGKPLLPRRIAFPPLSLISARAVGHGFAEPRYNVP